MPDPIDPDRVAMNEIRDRLIEATEEHDRRRDVHHDSDPCINFRCNAIAFLAHCLGLRQPHLARISKILESYEADHVHKPIDGTNLTAMDRETHGRVTRGEDPHPH